MRCCRGSEGISICLAVGKVDTQPLHLSVLATARLVREKKARLDSIIHARAPAFARNGGFHNTQPRVLTMTSCEGGNNQDTLKIIK